MTSLIDFSPPINAPFTFNAQFDGDTYQVVVSWNHSGQRYYINIYDRGTALVCCLPRIESPDDFDISMTAGYFTSTLIYRASTNQFEINP